MDVGTIFSSSLSLKEVLFVRDKVLEQPHLFSDIFELIFDINYKVAWRAAWTVEKVSETNLSFFREKDTLRLMIFLSKATDNSLKRAILSILTNLPIPKNVPVHFINTCFEKMTSSKEPIAIQVLSMRMLNRITDTFPEFIPELLATLENIDLTSVSAGYLAHRRIVLKKLDKRLNS